MAKYELMMILKPLLPEDIRANIQKKVESLVKESNGSIIKFDSWGKRHLAYQIDSHEEGYYLVYQFNANSATVKNMQNQLKLTSDVVRFLLTKIK